MLVWTNRRPGTLELDCRFDAGTAAPEPGGKYQGQHWVREVSCPGDIRVESAFTRWSSCVC